MLEALILTNFKAFKSQELPLRPLTLLTGLNGMGKSSVLQSLLLLRQSFQQRILRADEGGGFVLNGELARLGTGRDVLFDGAETDEIALALVSDESEAQWRFEYDRQADVLRFLPESRVPEPIYQCSLFTDSFHFHKVRSASAESLATIDTFGNRRRFVRPDGRHRTFEWHLKGIPNGWRIHILADEAERKVMIGYVGKHLPTVRYPT